MMGGTKEGELRRSAEIFENLCREKHPYFALAFLYDLGYGREEIKRMMEILGPRVGMERAINCTRSDLS